MKHFFVTLLCGAAVVFSALISLGENTNYPGSAPSYGTGFSSVAMTVDPVVSSNMPVPFGRAWTNGIAPASLTNVGFVFPLTPSHGYIAQAAFWTTNSATGGTGDIFRLGIDYSEDGSLWTSNSGGIGNPATWLLFSNGGAYVSNTLCVTYVSVPSSTLDNFKWGRLTCISNGSATNSFFFGTPPTTNASGTVPFNWGTNWQINGIIFSHLN